MSKRIRTAYFWTKKVISDAQREADELFAYFKQRKEDEVPQPKRKGE